MNYTVIRIDEDLDFGCEERLTDSPVMAIVTLEDENGQVHKIRIEDKFLYESNINEGDQIFVDENTGKITK